MNIGELKKLIKDMPDDLVVLSPGGDHAYFECSADIETVLQDKKHRTFCEDPDANSELAVLDEQTEFGERIQALVVSSW